MATQIKPYLRNPHRHPRGAVRLKLVELLNARLADAFELYAQLKQAHGNVKSTDFIQLHELCDAIAESVLEPLGAMAAARVCLKNGVTTWARFLDVGIEAAVGGVRVSITPPSGVPLAGG